MSPPLHQRTTKKDTHNILKARPLKMLKPISIKSRTLFLELFTQELILNSKPYIEITIPEKIIKKEIYKSVGNKELPKEKKIDKGAASKEISLPKTGIEKPAKNITPTEKVKAWIANTAKEFILPNAEETERKFTEEYDKKPLPKTITQKPEIKKEPQTIKTVSKNNTSEEISLPDIREIEKKLIEKHITEPLPKTITQKSEAEKERQYIKSSQLKKPTPVTYPKKMITPVAKTESKVKKPRPMILKKSFTAPASLPEKPFTPLPVIPPPPNQEINLGKLNILTSDPGITTIECPGPEKFILVKKEGRVNITSITLSQEEINKMIYDFSESARIPAIGGTFKAIVGNISISAIVTNSIGDRFILYKTGNYPSTKSYRPVINIR
jgi:hypothetical protein